MPLAPAFGSNTLWLEPAEAEEDTAAPVGRTARRKAVLRGEASAVPLEGDFGTLHRFHGHELFHFTRPNQTPVSKTRLDRAAWGAGAAHAPY